MTSWAKSWGRVHTAVYRIPEIYPLDANSTLAPCGITTKYVSKRRQMSQGIRGMWHRKSNNALTTNQHSRSMKRYVYQKNMQAEPREIS